MEECFGDYNMKICIIYLDDIIIFAKELEERIERLYLVLTRLKEHYLKLSAEKCFFMQKNVHFLGQVLSDCGIETEPDKIKKVKNWPVQKNADDLRPHFGAVGIAGLYIGRLRNCLPFLTSFTQCRMANLHIKCFDINAYQRLECYRALK